LIQTKTWNQGKEDTKDRRGKWGKIIILKWGTTEGGAVECGVEHWKIVAIERKTTPTHLLHMKGRGGFRLLDDKKATE